MPANTAPVFVLTANRGTDGSGNFGTRLTTANTTRDLSTTTNGGLILSAGANGTRVETITFTHSATSQTQAAIAAVGRVFICTSSAGANARILSEVALPAGTTPSATVVGAQQSITFSPPLFIPTGSYLWATISATQTSGAYDVTVQGGDY
jgi:hypothetical protein